MKKNSMLGLVVVILISWAIIYIVSKKHLSVLGLKPTRQRLMDCGLGLLFGAICCSINLIWQAHFKGIAYHINPDYNIMDALNGISWTFIAALFEEFIFRGVLLYLLIKKLGIIKACILSALAFGVYHWFSYGLIGGRIVPMVYVLLLTGAGGWMFAYAFAKTKSLYLPFGLHFGWIVISIVLLSVGPLGDQYLIPSDAEFELSGWANFFFFAFQTILVPLAVTWYLFNRYARVKENVA